jgi:hypothetical protein
MSPGKGDGELMPVMISEVDLRQLARQVQASIPYSTSMHPGSTAHRISATLSLPDFTAPAH